LVGGQRALDPRVVELMQRTNAASGYLVLHWIKTRDELMAAAAEISDLEE
jgi:hypothetical protein